MGSSMGFAQDNQDSEETREVQQKDPRAVSIDEALDPTVGTVESDAQDFFDSFDVVEPSDDPLLTEEELNNPDAMLGDNPDGELPDGADGFSDVEFEELDPVLTEETYTDDAIFEGNLEDVQGDDSGDAIEGELPDGILARDAPSDELSPARRFGDQFLNDDPESMEPIPDQFGVSRVAVIRGLDKITARVRDVEVPVGRPVMYERFEILVQACSRRPPEETPETTAFIEITEHRLDGELENVFSGWMFASSPSMNPVEHPVYDVWLIDCRTL